MQIKTLVASLTLAFVLASGIAFAGEENRRHDGRHDGRNDGPRCSRDFKENSHRFGPRSGEGHGPMMRGRTGFGEGFGPMHGGHGFGMMFMDKLDFTTEQKAKFVDILTEQFRANLELRIQLNDVNKKIRDIRTSDAISDEALIAANRDAGEIRGKMQALNLGLKDKLKAILTPEQTQKFDDMRKGMRQGMRGRADRDDWRQDMRGHRGPRFDRDGADDVEDQEEVVE